MTFAGFKKICDSTHHKAINPKTKDKQMCQVWRVFKGQVGYEIHTGHKRSQQKLSHRSNMDYHKINAELSVATETKEILTYSIFSTDLNGDTKRRTTGKRDTFWEKRPAGPMEKYQGTPMHPPEKSKCLVKKEHELLSPRHRHRSSIAR